MFQRSCLCEVSRFTELRDRFSDGRLHPPRGGAHWCRSTARHSAQIAIPLRRPAREAPQGLRGPRPAGSGRAGDGLAAPGAAARRRARHAGRRGGAPVPVAGGAGLRGRGRGLHEVREALPRRDVARGPHREGVPPPQQRVRGLWRAPPATWPPPRICRYFANLPCVDQLLVLEVSWGALQ